MAVRGSCPACNTPSRVGAKFCDFCGRALTAPGAAEYKQVTVLFTDVVQSMDLAARVGPERLREIMTELVDRCGAVIRRFGGTPDKFTGDGLMAVFGAPTALEDHALRACLAALQIQAIDGLGVQLRVGLNSGQVIAGEIGSGPWSYTSIGQAVGMAQRMESVAPPGGVMLSSSTARLVEDSASLGDPEAVLIKGSDDPVPARRLLGMTGASHRLGAETRLIGRRRELDRLLAVIDRAAAGHGSVVGVAGPAGIGKSRLVSEALAAAGERNIPVFRVYCESHTADVPFHLVTRLLRAVGASEIRGLLPDADPEDLALLDDLLGYRDPAVHTPQIDADARRRRLTGLINTASLARRTPAVLVIEDTHWIDQVSASLIADFLTVITQTPSAVLITYRPDRGGVLSQIPDTETIALSPLTDPETVALVTELLGSDRSVEQVAAVVTDRAVGNPFYAAEMVRDLTERGVLEGGLGHYTCHTALTEIRVPPTLQSTIAARIDRLPGNAKTTLYAAAVIGNSFDTDLFADLGVATPELPDLLAADLVERMHAGYAFRHPLIRTVAYESQLRADRAELHRRLAGAIEAHHPGSVDENAALIAEHLEAAGDLKLAFGWQMRAAMWSNSRDYVAAQSSWERARQLADELPGADPDRLALRIAPRTMLCATAFRKQIITPDSVFDELAQLCAEADDKVSLAVGMTGRIMTAMGAGDVPRAAQLTAEQLSLIDSIGDADLAIALFHVAAYVLVETGNWPEALRWSQNLIDLAHGDPTRGALITGSPLAFAYALRGTSRWALGSQGWQDDYERAKNMSRGTDRLAYAQVLAYTVGFAVGYLVIPADDDALHEVEQAARVVEERGDNTALGVSWFSLGVVLSQRDAADRTRAGRLLDHLRQWCIEGRYYRSELPVLDGWLAWLQCRDGDPDEVLPAYERAVDALFIREQYGYCPAGAQRLTDMLLARGTPADIVEAASVLARLEALPVDLSMPFYRIVILHMRAALARARGQHSDHHRWATEYHELAARYGYEGHRRVAAEMLAG
jgi:adenylate cyclase